MHESWVRLFLEIRLSMQCNAMYDVGSVRVWDGPHRETPEPSQLIMRYVSFILFSLENLRQAFAIPSGIRIEGSELESIAQACMPVESSYQQAGCEMYTSNKQQPDPISGGVYSIEAAVIPSRAPHAGLGFDANGLGPMSTRADLIRYDKFCPCKS
ncbi:hypothetical protein ABW21_db0204810 [Orbilia brochopaga]|nr:hypothetical protein ABW21_db0204810 [Drechslerella brochopaga]